MRKQPRNKFVQRKASGRMKGDISDEACERALEIVKGKLEQLSRGHFEYVSPSRVYTLIDKSQIEGYGRLTFAETTSILDCLTNYGLATRVSVLVNDTLTIRGYRTRKNSI